MSLYQWHLLCFTSLIFIIWFHTESQKNVLSCIIARIRGYVYKVLGINSAILLHLQGYDAKSKILISSLKFKMLTDNNQIFRNWFVIIHCHLTKVSAQIIQCIIFERNELSITLSTLWYYFHYYVRCNKNFAILASKPLQV